MTGFQNALRIYRNKLEIWDFSDLDYLDQIPDNETMDEPIPFPYGGRGKFNTWKLK